MARYKGCCIGGVADGHWLERDDVAIRVDMRRKLPIDVNTMNGDTPVETIESTDYRFLLLLGTSNAEIGVWAPQDVTLEQVVARLVRCYNPRTGLIGTPPANILPIRNG